MRWKDLLSEFTQYSTPGHDYKRDFSFGSESFIPTCVFTPWLSFSQSCPALPRQAAGPWVPPPLLPAAPQAPGPAKVCSFRW